MSIMTSQFPYTYLIKILDRFLILDDMIKHELRHLQRIRPRKAGIAIFLTAAVAPNLIKPGSMASISALTVTNGHITS